MSEPQLSGPRKVAIAMVALGEDTSAAVLKHFKDDEIEIIAKEIAALGPVPTATNEKVLSELREEAAAIEPDVSGGIEHARRLLQRSLGPEQSKRILERLTHAFQSQAGFAALEKAKPDQLAKFILGEHPQTIAIIVAHLNSQSAAGLLAQLPEDLRADVLMRMASLSDIPPDVIAHISQIVDQRLKVIVGVKREQRGGMRAVADLFNRLEKAVSKAALERIEGTAPEMAANIRNMMFVFDDITTLDDAAIREIVQRAEKKDLTIALKGANETVRTKFMSNMAKRAGEAIKEEMEMLGAVKLRDVEKAQQAIVAVVRELEEEGLISSGGASAGEEYVA